VKRSAFRSTLAAVAVVFVCLLPAFWAGDPDRVPGWFRRPPSAGVPRVVLMVTGMLIALVVLAGICSVIASRDRRHAGGNR
jgi:hypothetical protein